MDWPPWADEIPVPPNAVRPDNLHPVDPNFKPWVPSPELPDVELPTWIGASGSGNDTGPGVPFPAQSAPQEHAPPPKEEDTLHESPKRRSRLSVFYWINRLRSTWARGPAKDKSAQAHATTVPVEAPAPRRLVTPAEWKAYGHWARPRFGSVCVRNATPPPFRRDLTPSQVEAVMRTVRTPDGASRPENWIPRLEHPALPPRPALWPSPPPSPGPAPRAHALQLNPLLAHRRAGQPMLDYDLRHRDLWVFVGPPLVQRGAGDADAVRAPVALELGGPNGAQPATHPGVGALSVTMLAEDPRARFCWPFIVLSRHPALPVTVQDVLEAVHENFRQCLTADEVASLGPFRKSQLFRTYWARVQWFPSEETAGLRRVDYLGDCYMFRGLEPAPDGDGFMIYFGPQR